MYLSIRTYRLRSGSVEEAMKRVDSGLADRFAEEPGFLAYEVAKTGEHTVASVTMFTEREQAEASNDVAARWVAENLPEFGVERMGVIGGEVLVSRADAELVRSTHD